MGKTWLYVEIHGKLSWLNCTSLTLHLNGNTFRSHMSVGNIIFTYQLTILCRRSLSLHNVFGLVSLLDFDLLDSLLLLLIAHLELHWILASIHTIHYIPGLFYLHRHLFWRDDHLVVCRLFPSLRCICLYFYRVFVYVFDVKFVNWLSFIHNFTSMFKKLFFFGLVYSVVLP